MYYRTWAEISLEALEHNYKEIKKLVGNSNICCIVKANAYGHGAMRLAFKLSTLGVDFFAVATADEALELRKSGIRSKILILGAVPVTSVSELCENNISVAISSKQYAYELAKYMKENDLPLNFHLKVDTGMRRLGFDSENILEMVDVCNISGLKPQGIFTHFAESEEDDDSFTKQQYQKFVSTIDGLKKHGVEFEYRHCANSAAVLKYNKYHMDLVRAGIILYGVYPSDELKELAKLRPVMQLKSTVAQVKSINAGDSISYNRTFTAKTDMKIAIVEAGYADGVSRKLSNRGFVLIHGQRVPIVGNICMDMFVVDVSCVDNVKFGDTVTIFGVDGDEFIGIEELSDYAETIPYELLCNVSERVPRVYK